MACKNYFEVNRVIWNTRLPFENEPRTSPVFSWMGSEWCFRFVYRHDDGDHHCISINQMSEGKMELKEAFRVKTYMMPVKECDGDAIDVRNHTVVSTSAFIWYCGNDELEIFKKLKWLDDCPEVKFACRFYGRSSLKLQTGTDMTVEKSVQVSQEVPQDMESLSSDFSHLLEKEVLPDVRLECGGRTFQAHKSVLAARSQVFRAMFLSGMLESETGAVKIPDVDVAVLEKLLKFVYTGKPEDISEGNAADLYEAADKYAVLSLKTACAYWILRNLTEENCVKFLVVADSHSDRDLRAAVVSFIVENPSVLKSEAWFRFSEEPSKLTNVVYQAYVASTTV